MSVVAVVGAVASILDKIIPDPVAAAAAKAKLFELQLQGDLAEITAKAGIIQAEASSEHWLAATWRPILMLTFGALIVARWLGFSAPNINEAEVLALWDIVQVGLGGYVIGRSAEKIVPQLADALKKGK